MQTCTKNCKTLRRQCRALDMFSSIFCNEPIVASTIRPSMVSGLSSRCASYFTCDPIGVLVVLEHAQINKNIIGTVDTMKNMAIKQMNPDSIFNACNIKFNIDFSFS